MSRRVYIPKHFKAYELVPPEIHKAYSEENIFGMFDSGLLRALDRLREQLWKPIIINNWHNGGKFTQRGLRTDMTVGSKLSQHRIGKAFDFDVVGMSAEDVRKFILKNESLFYEIKRMEDGVNWVHIDSCHHSFKGIHLFKP